jgi:DNA-binding XRE family transcriptional regulator
MPKPLSADQLAALRAVPIGSMPNKLRVAIALVQAKQMEIAAETGYPAQSLSRLVTGQVGDPELATCHKLAAYFGCYIEDLFPAKVAA